MTECRKCGFANEDPEGVACPKCGAVYAKVERSKQLGLLNQRFEKEMETAESIFLQLRDEQREKDSRSYSGVQALYPLFFILAALTGLTEIVFGYMLWGELVSLPFFSNQDKVSLSLTLIVGIGLSTLISVAILAAIGFHLKLAKDTADNTRATREYLAMLVKGR